MYFLRLGVVALAALAVGGVIEIGMLSLQAARSVINPTRLLDTATPADYGLHYEPVEFLSTDGILLRGWFIPGGPATIILTHGHAGNKGSMLGHAQYLQQEGGYSVLLFDFRACGESEGTDATLGYREREDVLGAIAYLKTRQDIDPERIGGLGASMGAATLLLLGEEAHAFRALVADSSFASGDSLVARFDRWFRLPSIFFAVSVPWAIERLVGLRPSDIAPKRTVGEISPTPVFLIHGELDTGIPAEDAYTLYDAAGAPKELWVISEAGHSGGYGLLREEYQSRILAFFERYLGPDL